MSNNTYNNRSRLSSSPRNNLNELSNNQKTYSNRSDYHQLFRSFESFENTLSKHQNSFTQLSSEIGAFEKRSSSFSTHSKEDIARIIDKKNKVTNDLKELKSALNNLQNNSHSILKRGPKRGNTRVSLNGWYGNISGHCIKLHDQIDGLIRDLEVSMNSLDLVKDDNPLDRLARVVNSYSIKKDSQKAIKKTISIPSHNETARQQPNIAEIFDPLLPIIVLYLATLTVMSKNRSNGK